MVDSILLVFAFVLFALSAIGVPSPPVIPLNYLAAGLACWVLSVLF
jgi:hypothetical protein